MTRQHDLHPAEVAFYAAIRAGHTWHEVANKAMRVLVERGQPFSADDFRQLTQGQQPPHHNAIGGLFMSWSKAGLITQCGWKNSTATKRNGGAIRIWKPTHTDTLF